MSLAAIISCFTFGCSSCIRSCCVRLPPGAVHVSVHAVYVRFPVRLLVFMFEFVGQQSVITDLGIFP